MTTTTNQRIKNPILSGFYPDPSICKVNSDYFLVTSTFSYFPGVPIFHSTDLVNWNQIGNVLDRTSQIPMEHNWHSGGIFAPTIRFNNGIFYMITTNVGNIGNFVVTSTNPFGDNAWSEPYPLDAEGIDPSLFFDDDGKCYYCGTRGKKDEKYYGDNEIYVREFCLRTNRLIGEDKAIWTGFAKNSIWAEGPHIYKKDGYYYLLISEGGTGYHHALTIARSKELFGEFEENPANPILTHRHLGNNYPISNVGHADLVQVNDDEWYMVCLASRIDGEVKPLGRETFLVPVTWENGWPIVNIGVGKLEMEIKKPNLPYCEPIIVDDIENFENDKLPLHFLYLKNPDFNNYSLSERKSFLRMKLDKVKLNEIKSQSFVCRRQQSFDYSLETKIDFNPNENDKAGLVLYQSNEFYYSFYLTKKGDEHFFEVAKCEKGIEEVVKSINVSLENSLLQLKIHCHQQNLNFSYKFDNDKKYVEVANNLNANILSTDIAGGFVGNCLGIFGNSDTGNGYVDFDWLKLSRL